MNLQKKLKTIHQMKKLQNPQKASEEEKGQTVLDQLLKKGHGQRTRKR